MVRNRLVNLMLLVSGGVSVTACASGSHSDQVRDARLAEIDEAADTRETAVEEHADQRNEAIEQRYDALHASQDNREPDAQQSAKLLDKSQERAEYQSASQEKLEKIAVRLDAAQRKLTMFGGVAPTELTERVGEARREYAAAQQDLASMRAARVSTSRAEWKGEKMRFNMTLSDLDERVEKLNEQIEDSVH